MTDQDTPRFTEVLVQLIMIQKLRCGGSKQHIPLHPDTLTIQHNSG
jgi:hypothetical protein